MYQKVIFLQDEEAVEALNILENEGEENVIDYLVQWDYDEGGKESKEGPWGKSDSTYESEGYILSYNLSLGYIGLSKLIY